MDPTITVPNSSTFQFLCEKLMASAMFVVHLYGTPITRSHFFLWIWTAWLNLLSYLVGFIDIHLQLKVL